MHGETSGDPIDLNIRPSPPVAITRSAENTASALGMGCARLVAFPLQGALSQFHAMIWSRLVGWVPFNPHVSWSKVNITPFTSVYSREPQVQISRNFRISGEREKDWLRNVFSAL